MSYKLCISFKEHRIINVNNDTLYIMKVARTQETDMYSIRK